ncbi:MAG: S-layer homology domain-containing protein [Trueperaceae bacterium]|nr:S-layer homology domain-containing protein [Trueperaceae bacterium]
MRKFLITILAALVAGGLVSAQSFPDIPSGHWAGDAVVEIADLGIVIGFPDGTFRGNEAFTRYQSALVISRLLAVVDANMADLDAAHSDAIAALRASMQELAADVAAQGVRLAATESAVAGLSDNVAANAARLDAVEATLADLPEGMDEAVLRDLQNQIASQRVAIDTAQAQAEAAEARANGAYDLALQALAAADANASDISALNQTLQLLSQRVDGLGGTGPVAAPVDLSGIARNAGDIANIREFVILLRRDQVALRDRVSALEAADLEIAASVSDLEARVTVLETNPYGFSGSITVDYYVGRTLGAFDFDVDRAYGVNAPESMGNSFFSTGSAELNADHDEVDVGEVAQDRADITDTTGVANGGLSAGMTFVYAADGTGSPRGLNSFTAVATIELDDSGADGDWAFNVTDFTATFEPIGAEPLTFAFGEEVATAFTRYVFVNEENGFVATVSSPDFLAFLNPGLTIAYLSDQADGYMRGINGTMAPTIAEGIVLSGGVSFVQYAQNAADKDDVLADNVVTTVWGLDGMAGVLDLVELDFEYASSSTGGVSNGDILYVVAEVNGDSLPILNSLGGNYRSMDLGFDGVGDTGDTPFELGQSGFGVEASLGLFILDVTGFFDSYTNEASTDANVGFGVEVTADLFAGFSLTGFYESASVNGAAADATANVSDVNAGYVLLDGDYATKFGVRVNHNGDAANALIANLNIEAGYERWETDYSRTLIYASADYSLDVSIVSLSPYVGYTSDNDTDAGTNDYTELVAGVGLQTQALDIILKPSLMAAANYRSTTYSDTAAFTATELQWSVGVNLDEFLLPYSSLTAKFGSWTGTNTNTATNTVGVGDGATDISGNGDVDQAGAVETVMGYEVVWNYFDLEFGYGVYTADRAGSLASAQAFSISYTVDF